MVAVVQNCADLASGKTAWRPILGAVGRGRLAAQYGLRESLVAGTRLGKCAGWGVRSWPSLSIGDYASTWICKRCSVREDRFKPTCFYGRQGAAADSHSVRVAGNAPAEFPAFFVPRTTTFVPKSLFKSGQALHNRGHAGSCRRCLTRLPCSHVGAARRRRAKVGKAMEAVLLGGGRRGAP